MTARFGVRPCGPVLWAVVDLERNVIVATWQSRTAADADCAHQNRRLAVSAFSRNEGSAPLATAGPVSTSHEEISHVQQHA